MKILRLGVFLIISLFIFVGCKGGPASYTGPEEVNVPIDRSDEVVPSIETAQPESQAEGETPHIMGLSSLEGKLMKREIPTHYRQVSSGKNHTCAIAANNSVWCFGDNTNGQLGQGTLGTDTGKQVPVPIRGVENKEFEQVVSGEKHTCARKLNGAIFCWGGNDKGQLGNNTIEDNPVPKIVIGADYGFTKLFAGANHNCGIKEDGSLWCWGKNQYGQAGIGNVDINPVKTAMKVLQDEPAVSGVTWQSAALGENHTCALSSAGKIYCWGGNYRFQLGYSGTFESLPWSKPYIPVDDNIYTFVAVGGTNSCAIRSDFTVWCWGDNASGWLGTGSSENYVKAPQKVGTKSDWIFVSSGGEYVGTNSGVHTCAIDSARKLWCWGFNQYGQLGNLCDVSMMNAEMIAEWINWLEVSAGDKHTCGITEDHELMCWGRNAYGQCGYEKGADMWAPTKVPPSS